MRGSLFEWTSCGRPPHGGWVPRRPCFCGKTAPSPVRSSSMRRSSAVVARHRGRRSMSNDRIEKSTASPHCSGVDVPVGEADVGWSRARPPSPGKSSSARPEMAFWRSPATSCAPREAGVVARPLIDPQRIAERQLEPLLSGREPSLAVRVGRLCHRYRRRVRRPVGGGPAHQAIDASLEGPSCGSRLLDAGKAATGPEFALR
jgi:hypothetical protein